LCHRTYPGRFTATYLLLLAIERGYEAQAAAVDWIVGKDWPQAADTAAQQEETDEDILMGLDSSSPVNAPAFAGSENGSSMDTQQLLGGDAADALQLADTASSWVQQMQRHQARQAHAHAAQHRVQNATTGGTAATVGSMVAQQVRWTLGSFVEACQDHVEATFWRSALLALVNATGLHASGLTRVLEDLRGDVVRARRHIQHGLELQQLLVALQRLHGAWATPGCNTHMWTMCTTSCTGCSH
jgi:hypothetical protein